MVLEIGPVLGGGVLRKQSSTIGAAARVLDATNTNENKNLILHVKLIQVKFAKAPSTAPTIARQHGISNGNANTEVVLFSERN